MDGAMKASGGLEVQEGHGNAQMRIYGVIAGVIKSFIISLYLVYLQV